MNIAFIHPNYPGSEGSGAVHTATKIVTGISSRGHDLTVYCPEDPREDRLPNPEFTYRVISESLVKPHPYLHVNRALQKHIEEFEEYDLLHSYVPRTIPTVAKIGAETGTATVNTLNGYGGVCPKNDLLYNGTEACGTQGTLRCANCIIKTDHEALKYKLGDLANIRLINTARSRFDEIDRYQAQAAHVGEKYARFDFPTEKISVVPNILDEQFLIDHRSSFSEPYRLLYVGRLQRSKGTDDLLSVFHRVMNRLEAECQLTLVGGAKGDFEDELREQASRLGIENQVTFEGHVDYEQIPEIYADHDLFVYPGRWDEPFARVFMEAMATGTPIVSTDVGGIRGIVDEAGVVVDTDKRDFADVIVDTLESETLHSLSRNGKQRAEAFRPSEIIPQFEALYEDVLNEKQKT